MHVDKSFTKIQARVRPPPIQAMPAFWEHLVLQSLPKSVILLNFHSVSVSETSQSVETTFLLLHPFLHFIAIFFFPPVRPKLGKFIIDHRPNQNSVSSMFLLQCHLFLPSLSHATSSTHSGLKKQVHCNGPLLGPTCQAHLV